jgi:hypothetical protein
MDVGGQFTSQPGLSVLDLMAPMERLDELLATESDQDAEDDHTDFGREI